MSSLVVSTIVFAVCSGLLLASAIRSRVHARRGRLPRSLVVEYAPRRGSTVIGDALLAEQDRRAASAALIDLAVRRKVRLVAEPARSTGEVARSGRTTVAVEIVDDVRLTPRDVALLEALFGSGQPGERVRRFSKDRRAVGRRLQAVVGANLDELTRAGLVAGTRPGRQAIRLLGAMLLIFTGGLLLANLSGGGDSASAAEAASAGSATGALAAGLGLTATIAALCIVPRGRARAFTAAADPWRTHLDGLRQYLTVAEADRLRALQSPRTAELLDLSAEALAELGTAAGRFALHERLLPYAVLLGVEREWMSHLQLEIADLGETSLDTLVDAFDVTTDLVLLADAVGSLAELGFALGELVGADGAALDLVGGLIDLVGGLGD